MRDRKRGTVRDLRRENRAAVLWSLYLSQPRSRQELSAATGLSAASVTNVIRELIDEGIVIETGLAESDGGRPRAMLGMNPRYGYVIGVDIGETRTRVELFDLTMTERAKAEYPLDRAAEHDVAVVVGQIASGLDTVLAEQRYRPGRHPRRRRRRAWDHRAGTRGARPRPDLRLGRRAAWQAAAGAHRPAAAFRQRGEDDGPGRVVVRGRDGVRGTRSWS